MPFPTLSTRLQLVADCGLAFCKKRFGRNGVKLLEEIHENISWKPTFQLKPHSSLILGVEVADNLYPQVLKIAAHDIKHFDFPIAVLVACPLDVYQADRDHKVVKLLKSHGFGIITVANDKSTAIQNPCIPLAQHISDEELEKVIRPLPPKVKVCFRRAHTVYQTNEGQGLQEAGQVVEALINSLARQAVAANMIPAATTNLPAASVIDALYISSHFQNHRAALGGARDFVKEYRNVASHAPSSAKEAMQKIRKCRDGFIDSVRIAERLVDTTGSKGFRASLHVT